MLQPAEKPPLYSGVELNAFACQCVRMCVFSLACVEAVPVVQLRIRGGNNKSEGRVEVYHEGEWGTICDDSWDMNDAIVVCRQLNYSFAIRKSSRAEFGPGEGPIWLDNVLCNGSEQTLVECFHNGWNDHNCVHSEDAGVVCTGEPMKHIHMRT